LNAFWSFLLKNGIAHLEVKPSNLVYTNESRPRPDIIDFDITLQVQNEEEEIDDYCGGRDWMAPENGPLRTYSPVRADKWSCGHVLRLFAERHGKADEGLGRFAARLMNGNPRRGVLAAIFGLQVSAVGHQYSNGMRAGRK
jgi:serine/threonine protein kinase